MLVTVDVQVDVAEFVANKQMVASNIVEKLIEWGNRYEKMQEIYRLADELAPFPKKKAYVAAMRAMHDEEWLDAIIEILRNGGEPE